jgi:hypothetical protein
MIPDVRASSMLSRITQPTGQTHRMTAPLALLGQASTVTERRIERLNDGASTLNALQVIERPEEGRSHGDQVDRQRWVDAGDDLHDQAGGVAAIVRWAWGASGLPVVQPTR